MDKLKYKNTINGIAHTFRIGIIITDKIIKINFVLFSFNRNAVNFNANKGILLMRRMDIKMHIANIAAHSEYSRI